jgi:hypothetical protein
MHANNLDDISKILVKATASAAQPAPHLVPPDLLVPVDEVLTDHELVGVHHIQQLPAAHTQLHPSQMTIQ